METLFLILLTFICLGELCSGTNVVWHTTYYAKPIDLAVAPYLRHEEFTRLNGTMLLRRRARQAGGQPQLPQNQHGQRTSGRGGIVATESGDNFVSRKIRSSRGWFVRSGWFQDKQGDNGPSSQGSAALGGKQRAHAHALRKKSSWDNIRDKRYTEVRYLLPPSFNETYPDIAQQVQEESAISEKRPARNVFEIAPFLYVPPKNDSRQEGYANPPVLEGNSPEATTEPTEPLTAEAKSAKNRRQYAGSRTTPRSGEVQIHVAEPAKSDHGEDVSVEFADDPTGSALTNTFPMIRPRRTARASNLSRRSRII